MLNMKRKVDEYFGLEGDAESQFIYYGCIGTISFIMVVGTLANIFS